MKSADVIRKTIESYIAANLHTALPGRIESYEYDKQRANVQPLIKKKYKDDQILSLPVIVNVPVIFPRSGGASLTFPVNSGDYVLLIFSERALENWLSLGGEQEPGDARKFDLSDAIAIPGLYPFSESSQAENNTDAILKLGNGRVQIKPGEIWVKFGNGTFKATDGKIALGTSSNELISILIDLCDALINGLVLDPISGNLPFTPATITAFTAVKTDLNTIKGSL